MGVSGSGKEDDGCVQADDGKSSGMGGSFIDLP